MAGYNGVLWRWVVERPTQTICESLSFHYSSLLSLIQQVIHVFESRSSAISHVQLFRPGTTVNDCKIMSQLTDPSLVFSFSSFFFFNM